MTATHKANCTASNAPVLYLALDLGASKWKVRLEEEKHDPKKKTEPRGLTSANS